jgi:Protein tyrosine phosphatase-like protein, PTPLA
MATTPSRKGGGALTAWKVFSNAVMMLGWVRVLMRVAALLQQTASPSEETVCQGLLGDATQHALFLSFLELFNAVTGVTRSKPAQVLLFSVIRLGVEILVTPVISCASWQHVFTIACWSLGDSVRFACFLLDSLLRDGSQTAKKIRYTVGPILFPAGTLGEMVMVIAAANTQEVALHKYAIYGAASLWPVGFYALFTQLLRQRKKFFRSIVQQEQLKKAS